MCKNALHMLYDHLTRAERFAGDVEAMSRGDMDETEYLTTTCPRRSYTMNNGAFVGAWPATPGPTTTLTPPQT